MEFIYIERERDSYTEVQTEYSLYGIAHMIYFCIRSCIRHIFPRAELCTEYDTVDGVPYGIYLCMRNCMRNIVPYTELYTEYAI